MNYKNYTNGGLLNLITNKTIVFTDCDKTNIYVTVTIFYGYLNPSDKSLMHLLQWRQHHYTKDFLARIINH